MLCASISPSARSRRRSITHWGCTNKNVLLILVTRRAIFPRPSARRARPSHCRFIRRFRVKRSDMWSRRLWSSSNRGDSTPVNESKRPNHLRRVDRQPISTPKVFGAPPGRYRSGQTGQTVNLLALRLRWFESSPAQSPSRRLLANFNSRMVPELVASSLATVAATTTVPASASIAASATTGWPRLARAGFIHGQCATFNGLAVEFGNGILSVLLGGHRDKSKATRFAGEFILHESNFLHGASL